MSRDGEETARRVVAFARPARRPARERPRLPDEAGRILFFTGVRYERFADAPPPESCPPVDPQRPSGDIRLGG